MSGSEVITCDTFFNAVVT